MAAYKQRYIDGSIVYFNLQTQEIHPKTRNRAATVIKARWDRHEHHYVYTIKWSHTGNTYNYQAWQLGKTPFNLNNQGVK